MTRAQIAREKKALEDAYRALFKARAQRATRAVTLNADDAVTDLDVLRGLDAAAEIRASLSSLSTRERTILERLILESARVSFAEQALYVPTILSADPATWPPALAEQVAAAVRAELAAQEALLTQTTAAQIADYTKTLRDLREAGRERAEAAAELRARTRVALSHAEQEAIRVTTATQATFTEVRQVGAGITSYKWVSNTDERTRPEHLARNGQTFLWASPPADGHPGHAYGCRCFARPVIDNRA